jgi:hypothetical protein
MRSFPDTDRNRTRRASVATFHPKAAEKRNNLLRLNGERQTKRDRMSGERETRDAGGWRCTSGVHEFFTALSESSSDCDIVFAKRATQYRAITLGEPACS